MLTTHIPMDHLVALAEERRRRLEREAETARLARAARGPQAPSRLRRLRAALTAAWAGGPAAGDTRRPRPGAPPPAAAGRSRTGG